MSVALSGKNFEVPHAQGYQWLRKEIDEIINAKEVSL